MIAELHCKTNYSFLTGGSHPDELVERAVALGYTALAITDENSLAGVVRAYAAARHQPLRLILGAEIIPNDAPPVVLWAADRKGYANLSKLITVGRRRAPKGECWLSFEDIADHAQGVLAGVIPHFRGDRSRIEPILHFGSAHPSFSWFQEGSQEGRASPDGCSRYRELLGDRAYLMATLYQGIDDAWRIEQLRELSKRTGLRLVAAGDVLYHARSRMPLHDVLTAIKYRTPVASAQKWLRPNAERHLQSIRQRQKDFASLPHALQRTREIAERCEFCLSQLRYEYPKGLAPEGQTEIAFLRQLTKKGAAGRYPDGVPAKVEKQIEHELKLIDEMAYASYFLTVWDLVRFARGRGILCQGRGSAANSAVCYCLGVTSVDPETTDLLFERFISKERNEPPDIDVDFEHERREEVLQYLYEKYGRDRTGLTAAVVTYRVRGAVRDVGKALGLSHDRVDALAKQTEGFSRDRNLAGRLSAVGIDPESELGTRLLHLVEALLGFPRHLSQHVGGMVITQGKLDELVPIENATMEGRTVIQWDKNDLEELGLLKVDCLCLGMLSAIRKSFQLIQQHDGKSYTLASIPQEDPRVYDMICAADTIGVFQIESRGQMSMLPRLKPRCWYDLVIEVAIMRPGPIQGNMVHPYLKRRNGLEPVVYPNEAIKAVLQRTLGVPIFQEQAMKLAVVAAGFTPGEADQLRRAMGKWRQGGIIEKFRKQLIGGMQERGLSQEFAEQVFQQISGFGEYGFPESHAASFAKLVYVSAWLKRYYPAAFCASIINSYPMGFYAPAQLVADAKRHGVVVRPVDVNKSDWDCTLVDDAREAPPEAPNLPRPFALQLGFRMISGFRKTWAKSIAKARADGPFHTVSDFARRTRLGQSVIAQLSNADAFGSLDQDRRAALWQALAQEKQPIEQPLFADLETEDDATWALPTLEMPGQVAEDYRTIGLSLRAHPVSFYREWLTQRHVTTCGGVADQEDGCLVRVAGLVLMRQRPATAKGITFVTLEDETGTANLVVKPSVWERYYAVARGASAWIAHGRLEHRSGVIHVVVQRIEDWSDKLGGVATRSRDFR